MKKTYTKPEIEVMELHLEGMIAASTISVSNEYEVNDSESILSNEERGGSLWDD